jgi:hypothetical protein
MMLMKTLLFAAFGTAMASAGTITITETITTSGVLDGTTFTGKLVTLTLTGDTNNVTGTYQLPGTATVSVAGVGSDTFSDPQMEAFVLPGSVEGGISDVTEAWDVLDVHNVGFGTYALNTSFGPVSGGTFGNPEVFNTVGGTFTITGALNVDHPATFTATLVPETGTVMMLGAGLCLLGLGRRYMK